MIYYISIYTCIKKNILSSHITVLKYLETIVPSSYPHSVELQKANLNQETNTATNNTSPTTGTSTIPTPPATTPVTATNPLASAIPLAQLLSKPGALNALNNLSALSGLTDLLGGLANLGGPPVQTTGVHRSKNFNSRIRTPNTNHNDTNINIKKNERNKFNPY